MMEVFVTNLAWFTLVAILVFTCIIIAASTVIILKLVYDSWKGEA